ncbi:MAG: hypothetical protein ACEPO8_05590 [Rhodothermaceae bacterium]
MVEVTEHDGYTNLIISNEILEVHIFPEIGGKIHKIINKKSGAQYLLQSQKSDGRYNQPHYGANFEDFDTSGFDECFPNVSDSKVEFENGKELFFPDHGELWSRKWDYEIIDKKVKLSIKGVQRKYRFEKIVSLDNHRIDFQYKLQNDCDFDFQYIWSAHPLLNISEGDEIILPEGQKKLFLNWSSDASIGSFGDYVNWPLVDNVNDYSEIKNVSFGKAVKLFTDNLKTGSAGVFFKKYNETFLINFDTAENPYLGVWLTYGGWPVNSSRKHLTIGVEPTCGRPDCLRAGMENKEVGRVKAGAANSWSISFSILEGKVQV